MLKLSAQLEGISSRADRSWRLVFGTQELTPADIGRLGALQNAVCFLAVNDQVFLDSEIDMIKDTKAELAETGKSHSQRLRGVLFINWKNDPEGYEQFHDYYIVKMDKIINHFKSKLP